MKKPHWTDHDIQYLHDHAGLQSTVHIAKQLNRTPNAVQHKLCDCGISVFSNFYSARLLATELGCNHHTVMRWHKIGWLKGYRAGWRRKVAPMVFQERNIIAFLRKYCEIFRYRKIPNVYFRNTVLEELSKSGEKVSCLIGKS